MQSGQSRGQAPIRGNDDIEDAGGRFSQPMTVQEAQRVLRDESSPLPIWRAALDFLSARGLRPMIASPLQPAR